MFIVIGCLEVGLILTLRIQERVCNGDIPSPISALVWLILHRIHSQLYISKE